MGTADGHTDGRSVMVGSHPAPRYPVSLLVASAVLTKNTLHYFRNRTRAESMLPWVVLDDYKGKTQAMEVWKKRIMPITGRPAHHRLINSASSLSFLREVDLGPSATRLQVVSTLPTNPT
jgi:hypothetical protein